MIGFSMIKFSNFFFNINNTCIWKTKHWSIIQSFYWNSARMICTFQYSSEIEWEILSAKKTALCKPEIFRPLTALGKNLLSISTIWTSSLTTWSSMLPSVSRVSLCSANVIFSDYLILSESAGFTVRQNHLLSVRSFSFKFA